jgi:uncharacterized protein
MSEQLVNPISPSERIEPLDVLRGLALFGVMAINLVYGFRISPLRMAQPELLPDPLPASPLDQVLDVVLGLFIAGKAVTIFSLLFGVGLAIQAERLRRTGRPLGLLLRRLLMLLAIGLAHLVLIWIGDILTLYALAGLVALPFLFAPRWLLAAGAVFFLAVNFAMALLQLQPVPDAEWLRIHLVEADRLYGSGGFLDVLALRLHELPYFMPVQLAGLPRTVAMFLFGALVWRLGILQQPLSYRRIFITAAWLGMIAGIVFTIVVIGSELAQISQSGIMLVADLSVLALALGYSAVILLIACGPRGRKLLAWAAAVGRMAFTNYLTQSVIFSFVFYGYGLGLFNRMGVAAALALGIAVYAVQAVVSAWWLRRHRFGPVEWLWRTAMYGARQPWRVAAVAGS